MTRFLFALVFSLGFLPLAAQAGGVRFNNPFAAFTPPSPRGYAPQASMQPPTAATQTASVTDYAVPVPQPRPSGLYVAAEPQAAPIEKAEIADSQDVDAKMAVAPAPVPVAEIQEPKKPMTAQDRAEAKIMSSVVLGGANTNDAGKSATSDTATASPSTMFSSKPTSSGMMGAMPSLGLTPPAGHSGLGVLMAPDTQSLAVKD